jgi:hypothetical protein
MKERKPGTVREGRIPIYDHKGQMRGHVGPKATSVTVSRFINQHGAKLGKKDGRQAWIGPTPPPPKPPKPAKPAAPAQGTTPAAGPGAATHSLEISLKAAKGSAQKPAAKSDKSK